MYTRNYTDVEKYLWTAHVEETRFRETLTLEKKM